MTKKSINEEILFVKRIMHYSDGTWNGGNIITTEGNIYDFDMSKKYGGYKDISNEIFLIILNKIVQEKDPSRKCDKNDILKAYSLGTKINKNSEFVGLKNTIRDSGVVTLSVLIDEKLIKLMSYDAFTGAVDCEEINQIYDIMHKNGIYQFDFFDKNNFVELRKNPKVIIYPFLKDIDSLHKSDDDDESDSDEKTVAEVKSVIKRRPKLTKIFIEKDDKFIKEKDDEIVKEKDDKSVKEKDDKSVKEKDDEIIKEKDDKTLKDGKNETEKPKKRRIPKVKIKPVDE